MICQAYRSWIHKTRINIVQQLSAAKSVLNPLSTGKQIRCSSRYHRSGRKNCRDIIKYWISSFTGKAGMICRNRLIRSAKWILHRVKNFRELKTDKTFCVKPSNPIPFIDVREAIKRDFPEGMCSVVSLIKVFSKRDKCYSKFTRWINTKMLRLLESKGF